ncbi:MAG: LacI family DNA-binding transcriptional regulator [Sphingomonadales bacterium]
MSDQDLDAEPQPQVRMRDVARALGVSVSTVSRALSQPELVSVETLERVGAMAARMRFRPNLAARDLRTRSTRSLLVVVPSFSPLFLEIFRGAEREAVRRGYSVLMAHSGSDAAREHVFLDQVLSQRADGILLVTSADPARLAERQPSLPIMVTAVDTIGGLAAPNVRIDNVAAARTATAHLVALGHRRIAHIGGPPDRLMARDRAQGFAEAIAAAGLEPAHCPTLTGEMTLEAGEARMARLLTRYPRPTAVLAASDELAVGALQAIKRDGLTIGADVSVIGFDDLRIGMLYDPPLTTMAFDKVALGERAIAALVARIEGRAEGEPAIITLPTQLLERGSCGPPTGA